jgi:hypothetical protein
MSDVDTVEVAVTSDEETGGVQGSSVGGNGAEVVETTLNENAKERNRNDILTYEQRTVYHVFKFVRKGLQPEPKGKDGRPLVNKKGIRKAFKKLVEQGFLVCKEANATSYHLTNTKLAPGICEAFNACRTDGEKSKLFKALWEKNQGLVQEEPCES